VNETFFFSHCMCTVSGVRKVCAVPVLRALCEVLCVPVLRALWEVLCVPVLISLTWLPVLHFSPDEVLNLKIKKNK
jgi:hypothetical protein